MKTFIAWSLITILLSVFGLLVANLIREKIAESDPPILTPEQWVTNDGIYMRRTHPFAALDAAVDSLKAKGFSNITAKGDFGDATYTRTTRSQIITNKP